MNELKEEIKEVIEKSALYVFAKEGAINSLALFDEDGSDLAIDLNDLFQTQLAEKDAEIKDLKEKVEDRKFAKWNTDEWEILTEELKKDIEKYKAHIDALENEQIDDARENEGLKKQLDTYKARIEGLRDSHKKFEDKASLDYGLTCEILNAVEKAIA